MVDTSQFRAQANEADVDALFLAESQEVVKKTNRVFVVLMLLQWIAAVVIAMTVSPKTWLGSVSSTHMHVWLAIGLGGLLSVPAMVLGIWFSGKSFTKYALAIAQVLWSVLLIHLSGGRIETHFHVFGSLAFVAFYRDWRVLVVATIVVAGDHFVRGVWFPQSVFGIVNAGPWRWVEHAAWVVFEDIFLTYSCVQGQRDLRGICHRQVELEAINAAVGSIVRDRTAELEMAFCELEREMDERLKAERERESLNRQFIAASRQAGMAEVATGVLHNVGNVLNSVTVSCNMLLDGLKNTKLPGLTKAVGLMDQHEGDLSGFFQTDKGAKLPEYLRSLSERLTNEHAGLSSEVGCLRDHVEHITEIVGMQQSYARGGGFSEELDMREVLESAIQINGAAFLRHGVEVEKELASELPMVLSDKHRLLQILINLIGNAKQAVTESSREDKMVCLRVLSYEKDTVTVEVHDNGVGIPPENLDKIFGHGFTTKSDGHGFGLHSSANAATEIGGTLSVLSDGEGQGSLFRLTVPVKFDPAERADAEDLQLVGQEA